MGAFIIIGNCYLFSFILDQVAPQLTIILHTSWATCCVYLCTCVCVGVCEFVIVL